MRLLVMAAKDTHQDDASAYDADTKLLKLRAEFEDSASTLDRWSARARCILSSPLTAIIMTIVAVVWCIGNSVAPALGYRAWDPAPFQAMQAFGTVAAVIIASLILAGQRRDDEAALRRSQLTLHLAAQSEHKIAKLIALLEEQRRHNPLLPDREDLQAEQMAKPSEPRAVLDRVARADAATEGVG
jgi:uncharacterized membrane protein